MHADWERRRLGEVAHVEMGQSPPSEYVSDEAGSGVAFLQGNAEFTEIHPVPRLWCRQPAKMSHVGDALISVRAPVGAINRADQAYCIGRGLAAIRFRGLVPAFGHHALTFVAPTLRELAQGTTFEAVGGAELRNLSLAVPSPLEQRRIAEILDSLDEAIRSTEQVIAKLQQVKQGLLHGLLTRGIDENGELRDPERHPEQFQDSPLGRIPNSWGVAPVGKVFDSQLGKMLSKLASAGGNQAKYLTNRHVQWGKVVLEDLDTMSFSKAERVKFCLEPGDLLVCEGGEVGRTALWDGSGGEMYYQKALHRLRPKTTAVKTGFMARFMRFASERGMFADLSSQTSIAHLTQEKLALLLMLLPPPSEQGRMIAAWDCLDERIAREKHETRKLRAMKLGLTEELLTGRVRVTLPAEATP